jgi:glycosyltransferase involved in cell wall biosynthesis
MRAVIVSHAYADPLVRGKLRALASQGVTLAAAVPDRWTPPGLQAEQKTVYGEDGGVRTVPIPVKRSAPGGDPAWSTGALRRLYTDFKPDLVQIEEEPWTKAAGAATRAARKLRIPYVVLVRQTLAAGIGMTGGFRRGRVLRGARGVLGVSQSALALATRRHGELPHEVVPQIGVSLPSTISRPAQGGLSIGFLGRLIPEKGLDLLFRACVKVIGRWTITVVGSGPAQEELEELAERLGIAGRVHWLGALPRQAVEQVWPRLDCVAMPSRTAPTWVETVPRAALEAMAHGIPVVASASGALPEIVAPAGTIVPEDDVGALATALQALHDDPAERARLGDLGRQRVMAQFTDDAVARKTLEFWRRVAGAPT